jgi:hypothetical protein
MGAQEVRSTSAKGKCLPLVGVMVHVQVHAAVAGGRRPDVPVLWQRRNCPQRRAPCQLPAHPRKTLHETQGLRTWV